jgi:glutathione-regulated potassium-efflux system protein KefB
MDVGVTEIVRDTYASSLEIAAWVLEGLGEAPATAREAVRKFRQHDEATLAAQYQVKEDETKFLATTRESAAQLEKLFESDRSRSG